MNEAPYTRAEEPWDDVPTPEYAQRITFEGCEGVVMAPEDYERLYLYARTLERELADRVAELDDRVAELERDAAKWKDPSRVTGALVRYLLDTQVCDPKWAASMTRAIYAATQQQAEPPGFPNLIRKGGAF